MTKVLILIEGSSLPSFRVDEKGITFDHGKDPSRVGSDVAFIALDDVDATYDPGGKRAIDTKTGSYLDTYG